MFLKIHAFAMELVHSMVAAFQHRAFLASVDLKYADCHVPIFAGH